MTEVVIVRHAQSEWNAVGRWQGWADPPLSPLGREQAAAAGRALAAAGVRPDRVVASDLQRAVHTAVLLRDPDRAPEDGMVVEDGIVVDPGLREYDAGEWTGLRRVEIAERWPGRLEAWDEGRLASAPGGEDGGAFTARLLDALGRLGAVAPGGTVLAVSHGRAIHAIAVALGATSGHVGHLSGWRIDLDGGPRLLGPVALLGPGPDPTGPPDPPAAV